MNNVDILCKDILIIVKFDEHGFDPSEDIEVAVETENELRIFLLDNKLKKLGAKFGFCKVYFTGLKYFSLDKLKVTCKYPVVVRCDNLTVSKYIEPCKGVKDGKTYRGR